MKLARIILPDRDNEGASLFLAHGMLKGMLLELWGGFTETHGTGWWQPENAVNQREPIVIYEIAMERADVLKLRELARKMCVEARQVSVMMATPCGDVEFVKALDAQPQG